MSNTVNRQIKVIKGDQQCPQHNIKQKNAHHSADSHCVFNLKVLLPSAQTNAASQSSLSHLCVYFFVTQSSGPCLFQGVCSFEGPECILMDNTGSCLSSLQLKVWFKKKKTPPEWNCETHLSATLNN